MTMYNALSVDIVQAVDESFDLKVRCGDGSKSTVFANGR